MSKKRKKPEIWLQVAETKVKEFAVRTGSEAKQSFSNSIEARDALRDKILLKSGLLGEAIVATPLAGVVSKGNTTPLMELVMSYFGEKPSIMSEKRVFELELKRAERLDGNGDDGGPICVGMVPVPKTEWDNYNYDPEDSEDEPPEEECPNNVAPGSGFCYGCGIRARREEGKSFIFTRIREGRSIVKTKRRKLTNNSAHPPPENKLDQTAAGISAMDTSS